MNRVQMAQFYRSCGPKPLISGLAWANGGQSNQIGQVDLSLPLRGLRFVFKGRLVVGTANYASMTPEGYLNLLPFIQISGTNKRQGGNVTLWSGSLATLWALRHHHAYGRADMFTIDGTLQAVPSTPYPTYFPGLVGTDDFIIVVDLPFYPFGAPEGVRPGFLVREEEWKNTIQVSFVFGTVNNAAVAGALGTGAAGTTNVFTSFGSGAGSPTIDVYGLPVIMGNELKNELTPGFLSRSVSPIAGILQANGSNVDLQQLQKQATTRIYAKIGTGSAVAGQTYFTALSDTQVTALGVSVGKTRSIRNRVDVFAHKNENVDAYGREPVQGLHVIDFMPAGNPDAAFPASNIGDVAFALTGDVVLSATGAGEIIQEQMIYSPTGPLYQY